MASGKSEAHRIFHAMDSLLAQKKLQPVMEATESLIRKNPHDWEALYRQGLALQSLQKPAEAARRFQAMLDLPIGDDEKSALGQGLEPRPEAQARDRTRHDGGSASRQSPAGSYRPCSCRSASPAGLRIASRCPAEAVTTVWSPKDFGQATDGRPGLAAQPGTEAE